MNNKRVVVITSGYFNPIHRGHIECFSMAKNLFENTYHIVIINNEIQTTTKKGKIIIPLRDRISVVKELKSVDGVFICIDKDKSVCKSIEAIADMYEGHKIVFAKGGDRTFDEIPETKICNEKGIEIIDGLGEKIQSSSNILKNINDS